MHTIGGRLKLWRSSEKLLQKDAATHLGVPPRTYQDYERDLKSPGAGAIECFIRAGINANWLLTGEGPMLLANQQTPPANLDQERLALALQAVDEGLTAAKRSMAPGKKAELVIAVYDLFGESSISKERVLKLVKLAA